jgi:hypothetical protein
MSNEALWLMQRKRSLGCAHHFRPTYAGANVGHPSIASEAAMTQTPKGTSKVTCVPDANFTGLASGHDRGRDGLDEAFAFCRPA